MRTVKAKLMDSAEHTELLLWSRQEPTPQWGPAARLLNKAKLTACAKSAEVFLWT